MVSWVYKVRDWKNNLYLVNLEVRHIRNASFLYHLQVIIVQWLCHRRFIKVLSFVGFCVSWEKKSEQFKAQILKCIHEE
jgi:hypothetical protein